MCSFWASVSDSSTSVRGKAAAHALFPPKGEEQKKSEVERERHETRGRLPADAGLSNLSTWDDAAVLRRSSFLPLATVLVTAATCAAAQAAITPDAGGFRSLLPVGQGETADVFETASYLGTGTPPASFENQRTMFEALPKAGPDVSTADLGRYFKAAPFGVPAGEPAESVSPRVGVTITRDAYRVPHVEGTTRPDVMWGAGWVVAEDRLFLMDVLRRTARGRMTAFIGPGPNGENVAADVAQRQVTDYSDPELEAMAQRLADSGPEGAQVIRDVDDYLAGVNAYIADARNDPRLMPGEYALIGQPLPAVLSRGRRGDRRTGQRVLRPRRRRRAQGRRCLPGGVVAFWPQGAARRSSPTSAPRRIPRRRSPPPSASRSTTRARPATAASALPDPGTLTDARVVRDASATGGGSRDAPRWLARLRARGGLRLPRHASNAMVITAKESASGIPLLVAGPQVDFYAPSLFHEIDLHGPGISVRGVGIPGLGPFAVIGHGKDFAWSITTAQGDNTDTFAERLCEPDGSARTLTSVHYVRGKTLRAARTTR